jgi:hypothetical protein
MTKPDANSPDPGTNPDDAAWLDLVSRLESGTGGSEPTTIDGGTDNPPGRSFRDFDPLGLSAPAPTEPSAEERNATPPRQAAEVGGTDDDGTGGPRDYEPEEDEGFVPEEPPSLAGIDPLTMLAWLGAIGGPVALLLSAMFWRSAPLLAILGIVAVFVASVIYLIMKLPTDKDEYDDGARV